MVEKKISSSSWTKLLEESLSKAARKTEPRLAILGIGNELNGDDAAGVWVVRRLQTLLSETSRLLIVDSGSVPENHMGQLRRFQPDMVLLIDAADFGGKPGDLEWIDPLDTSGFSASSHSLPFSVLTKYLKTQLSCEVGLIGIQPSTLEFDAGLSSPVKNTLTHLVKELTTFLQKMA